MVYSILYVTTVLNNHRTCFNTAIVDLKEVEGLHLNRSSPQSAVMTARKEKEILQAVPEKHYI